MLISFEGIDGSGKSTQINLLRKKMQDEGHVVEVFRDPGGTNLSEKIRALLLNADHKIDAVAELLLFSAARAQLITQKVQPLLQDDITVILDRYYDSTIAYQGYGRASLPVQHIHEVNEIASHGLVPDVTFYLKISLAEAEKRTERVAKDRMEQSGITFYQKVIEGFDALARQEKRIKAIDATGSAQQTHRRIMAEMKERI